MAPSRSLGPVLNLVVSHGKATLSVEGREALFGDRWLWGIALSSWKASTLDWGVREGEGMPGGGHTLPKVPRGSRFTPVSLCLSPAGAYKWRCQPINWNIVT